MTMEPWVKHIVKRIILLGSLLLAFRCLPAQEPPALRLGRDRSVTWVRGNERLLIRPRFLILHSTEDPKLRYDRAGEAIEKDDQDIVLPAWQLPGGKGLTRDYFRAVSPALTMADKATENSGTIAWAFPAQPAFSLEATLEPGAAGTLALHFILHIRQDGWYSVGFAGLPELSPDAADGIWQPWVWQEKRFPRVSYLSVEEMCPLPATLVEKNGATYGIVADPAEMPFRLPNLSAGNIRCGVLLRNPAGMAQPMLFAPVLGNRDSWLRAGSTYDFRMQLVWRQTTLPATHRFIAEQLYKFKDYRENLSENLNTSLENMIGFAMDDRAAGWDEELKGFDYTADVARTVKVVSGLHALSVAVITDNEAIYRRRAVPMTEFNLSRQRFLFSPDQGVNGQNASSKLSGPGIEVAELAANEIFWRRLSPVFAYFADSLRHHTRILNLSVPSPGDSWSNLAGLFKMSGDSAILREAINKADVYIAARIGRPQTDFTASGADTPAGGTRGMSSHFWTDYAPQWMELLDLYEFTGLPRFLEAARQGAERYTQFIWFSPPVPDSLIVVGQQNIPAWRVSQTGLVPEAANTFPYNPAIFLTHFAAHLLRLSRYTGDPWFRSLARSAVVGRYSNFPGYTMNGSFGMSYARPDFPFRDDLHGLFYYNHVWPQIALLLDYLVSDAFALSGGKINFPDAFVPAYAYLKSHIYGAVPGSFFGHDSVYLWMPRQLLSTGNGQLNYLSARGREKLCIALMNQSRKDVETTLQLSSTLVGLDPGRAYPVHLISGDGAVTGATTCLDGKVRVKVPAGGMTALVIDSVTAEPGFQKKYYAAVGPQSVAAPQAAAARYHFYQTPWGRLGGALLSAGPSLNTLYCWLEARPGQLAATQLHYRVDMGDWQTVEDRSYPFEFSIPIAEGAHRVEYRAELSPVPGAVANASYQSPSFSIELTIP